MLALGHIGSVRRVLGPPGLYRCAKFGLNRYSTFDLYIARPTALNHTTKTANMKKGAIT